MRRFELVEGTSSKFWEVSVTDAELTVRFGRIGTQGQSKSKTFASAQAAQQEATKLIRDKTGKGYQEVGGGAEAPAPASGTPALPTSQPAATHPEAAPVGAAAAAATEAVASKAFVSQAVASKAVASKAAASPEPAVQPASPPASAASPAFRTDVPALPLVWPTGGFAWTESLRQSLPVLRGIRLGEFPVRPERIQEALKCDDHVQQYARRYWDELIQHGAPVEGDFWSEASMREHCQPGRLERRDPAAWRQLFLQCCCWRNWNDRNQAPWELEMAVALHGLPFALEVLLDCGPAMARQHSWWYSQQGGYAYLRAGLAAADTGLHQQCLALATARRGRDDLLDHAICYLFPEQSAWAEDCVARALPEGDTWWLDNCCMSAAAACRHFRRRQLYVQYAQPAALLQLQLHDVGALELLLLFLDKCGTRGECQEVLRLLSRCATPELLPALLARIDNRDVRDTLDKLTERWPVALLREAIALCQRHPARNLEAWAVRLALRLPESVPAALEASNDGERQAFTSLLQQLSMPEEAPFESLPELLRTPPWTLKQRPAPIPVLDLTPRESPVDILWSEADKARAAAYTRPAWLENRLKSVKAGKPQAREIYLLGELDILPAGRERLLAGGALQEGDLERKNYYYEDVHLLLELPPEMALAVWEFMPPRHWSSWNLETPVQALLLRHGARFLPGLLAYGTIFPEQGLALLLPCRAAAVAPLAAHALKNTKKARGPAQAWLKQHPETAIQALVPLALGQDRKARENAQYALRWLAQNGLEAQVRSGAGAYGAAAAAAVDQVLAVDPTLIVPARMPKLPAFFVPAALRRPQLRSGGALPVQAQEHLGNMLSISTLEEPYGGLEVVRAACTPESLAEFAWDLFEAWQAAGAPSKEGWAFAALGLLGNDETARRLAPKIREWPGEGGHARAVTGLNLLAAIGTDVALMHLNGIAGKVKFKALQERAREKIAQVAEARGLTPEELADRLVPDLGLDDNGTLVLDFGPRQFFVGFDESLKPFVKDADGSRLKDLPKPNQKDHPELSAAAVERYKAMKKDAKAIASLQLIRLEQGMCGRRRWSPAQFRQFFLEHPLMRHLARRLVWGVYRDGVLADAFRVAEDLSLANREDDLYELPQEVEIGVAHVLEMDPVLKGEFGQIFADYEILQPFRQLGRETYTLTEAEQKSGEITRFKDKTVATGSLMGLTNRGWERGEAQDGGWVGWFQKELPGGLEAELEMDPGTVVGDLSFEPRQRIPRIGIRRRGTWDNEGRVSIATLDPVVVSEILRDADLLAAVEE